MLQECRLYRLVHSVILGRLLTYRCDFLHCNMGLRTVLSWSGRKAASACAQHPERLAQKSTAAVTSDQELGRLNRMATDQGFSTWPHITATKNIHSWKNTHLQSLGFNWLRCSPGIGMF